MKQEKVPDIDANLLAIRSKLRRSKALRMNVVYEVKYDFFLLLCLLASTFGKFSLRGRWPVKRYNDLSDIQL